MGFLGLEIFCKLKFTPCKNKNDVTPVKIGREMRARLASASWLLPGEKERLGGRRRLKPASTSAVYESQNGMCGNGRPVRNGLFFISLLGVERDFATPKGRENRSKWPKNASFWVKTSKNINLCKLHAKIAPKYAQNDPRSHSKPFFCVESKQIREFWVRCG